ncbi:cytochrome c oxidase assembly protein COX20, mitochondrial [Topomyia yanbarensis]|uniref:cytochrome c oxidase assembly protein COX20, mitochondrial n=1 Tax=Topomyia yanbarensis TaxID=2498891 RepID=UPI00273A7E1D|nr:cytochrome c oxidase assembly protein COX20, mitochondrial [Topomyia yanbarensis]
MDKSKVDFDELLPYPTSERSVILFGRDLSQIPCFRSSFLYGISVGIAGGLAAFMKTSRPQLSTHVGFGTFMGTTLCYFFVCRYNWSKQSEHVEELQKLMQQHAMYEGTEKERELDRKAESV